MFFLKIMPSVALKEVFSWRRQNGSIFITTVCDLVFNQMQSLIMNEQNTKFKFPSSILIVFSDHLSIGAHLVSELLCQNRFHFLVYFFARQTSIVPAAIDNKIIELFLQHRCLNRFIVCNITLSFKENVVSVPSLVSLNIPFLLQL